MKMAQHFLLTPAMAGTRQPRTGVTQKDNGDFMGSPSKLVLAGVAGVIALAVLFLIGTYVAVQTVDGKAIDMERERATIAVGLLQQAGSSMDSVMAGKIGRDYVLRDAHLVSPDKLAGSEISVPLAGSSLVLAWTPRRIATETFALVAPFRIAMAALTLAGVMVILHRLFRLARDLEARRKAARDLATRDALTGLSNRRGFNEALDAAFASGSDLSLLYLDLDDFKQVNDRFGHATGDQLLLCVAQRLAHIVGPNDHVARLGGDEFVILRPGHTSRSELSDLATRIHQRVTLPYGLGDVEARVGLSIGIASRTGAMNGPSDLVGSADAALYRAKAIEATSFAFAEELVEGLPKAA
jgi:diguanylate cyclase (GGDEF)-like protein